MIMLPYLPLPLPLLFLSLSLSSPSPLPLLFLSSPYASELIEIYLKGPFLIGQLEQQQGCLQ